MALAPGTWPGPLLRAIRISNKYLLNPVMGALTGRKLLCRGHPAHRPKVGQQYSTPVGAARTQDGFIIPLGYGTGVDWLQNVLAAGQAALTVEGETNEVTAPEVIDAAAAPPMISPRKRRNFERVGIPQYLKVKLAESG